eukprot:2957502-Rhodomonas_salina.1
MQNGAATCSPSGLIVLERGVGASTPHHKDQPVELRLCNDDDVEGQDIMLWLGNTDDWDSERVWTIGTQTCCKGSQCS